MGFFPKLDREGPGFDPNAPRKTGFARFGELVSRDTSNLFRAGFLALAGCLPFLVGIAFAISSHVLLFAPLIGLVGGALAGPGLCGLADTVLRSLRDQPSMWGDVYRQAWMRSAGSLACASEMMPRRRVRMAIFIGSDVSAMYFTASERMYCCVLPGKP